MGDQSRNYNKNMNSHDMTYQKAKGESQKGMDAMNPGKNFSWDEMEKQDNLITGQKDRSFGKYVYYTVFFGIIALILFFAFVF